MIEEERKHLMELLDDDTKTTEQFALLITAWCHQNPIIEKCFGTIADYTELLLPNNILLKAGSWICSTIQSLSPMMISVRPNLLVGSINSTSPNAKTKCLPKGEV